MFKVKSSKSQSNISRTIRFTEDMFYTLNEIANNEDTSFNNLVLQCCQYAIDNYEQEKKADIEQ